eukprot:Phypoly_transcript_10851.p1 GENE.Phypoly_transcript_10851~~Phypoly_transcript_10851.p1  ORF type:complete len:290 (+),score=28.77 Phypoly_transcript_10851:377-1246(+)
MISKMKKFDDTTPLVIYEIGGGSGTNAKCIIEYLQKKHPRLFKSLEYNIIDLSKPLVELQKKHLKAFENKVKIYNTNVLNWHRVETRPCFIIMLEVLDNLAHDKVVKKKDKLYQVLLEDNHNEVKEHLQEITDTYIQQYFSIVNPAVVSGDDIYVPTVCIQLLHLIRDYFLKHHMWITDFEVVSSLYNTAINGINGFQIKKKKKKKKKKSNKEIEDRNILMYEGVNDYVFPTNFADLVKLYTSIVGRSEESINVDHEYDFIQNFIDPYNITFKDGTVGLPLMRCKIFTV